MQQPFEYEAYEQSDGSAVISVMVDGKPKPGERCAVMVWQPEMAGFTFIGVEEIESVERSIASYGGGGNSNATRPVWKVYFKGKDIRQVRIAMSYHNVVQFPTGEPYRPTQRELEHENPIR